MINFLLKYTGTYGLLAILAVAIVTPTYLFFSNQQEKVPDSYAEKQVVSNTEKVLEETAPEKKTVNKIIEKPEKNEIAKKENKPNFE